MHKVTCSAFADEMAKIASGMARSGIRPKRATTLLASGLKKASEIIKPVQDAVKTSGVAKPLALMGLGAVGLHQAQTVKRRYDTGKMLEYQQKQGY